MRRRTLALFLVFLLAALPALAGCLGSTVSKVRAEPYVALANAAPGRTADFALYVTTTERFREELDVTVESAPAGWLVEPEARTITLDGGGSTAVIVRVTPSENASHGLHRVVVGVGDGRAHLNVNVDRLAGEEARDGVGVQVHTVGFWNNGTIFYHNWAVVRDNPGLHWTPINQTREEAGADENMEPLKVYVGGKRGERPPEPYNSSGYVPVIQGFDERLHGMLGGETGAVRIPAEKAYTRSGNEGHALYGDDLNFVIFVKSVDVLPPDNRTCVPDTGVCVPPPGGERWEPSGAPALRL